jgi:hypothetical protein
MKGHKFCLLWYLKIVKFTYLSIVNRLRIGRPGFDFSHRRDFFLFSSSSGSHSASYRMCTESSSRGIKRLGREAGHSSPSSAEVKEWVELYLHSPIRLHGVVLSLKKKHRDNFTLNTFKLWFSSHTSIWMVRLAGINDLYELFPLI